MCACLWRWGRGEKENDCDVPHPGSWLRSMRHQVSADAGRVQGRGRPAPGAGRGGRARAHTGV